MEKVSNHNQASHLFIVISLVFGLIDQIGFGLRSVS